MTQNTMIKITNNATAATTAFNGNTMAANRVLYVPFAGNVNIQMSANADHISNVSDGTNTFAVGSGANDVARIQLGNLATSGAFFTNLDSLVNDDG